eukprot:gb/GFBE01001848.1/.p1 GENE.gb/GFBE01001848.1/~~gb/GFBE01001848.1/.p1  ORF type:complete len:119 (+),score=22.64 gb/GFBE01001848.1/:1-357(+)
MVAQKSQCLIRWPVEESRNKKDCFKNVKEEANFQGLARLTATRQMAFNPLGCAEVNQCRSNDKFPDLLATEEPHQLHRLIVYASTRDRPKRVRRVLAGVLGLAHWNVRGNPRTLRWQS